MTFAINIFISAFLIYYSEIKSNLLDWYTLKGCLIFVTCPLQNLLGLAFWMSVFWKGTEIEQMYKKSTKIQVLIFSLLNASVDIVRLYCCIGILGDNTSINEVLIVFSITALNSMMWNINYFTKFQYHVQHEKLEKYKKESQDQIH